jgi:adenosylcobinamide-phosphate synthase
LAVGASAALIYRFANTLDAMWGYRGERFEAFGWAAARLDDVLNWIPARLTALTYALLGNMRQALICWRVQGIKWKSPNAGPVMAAGAGALEITIGGRACYGGAWQERPTLGVGAPPTADDVHRTLLLIRNGVLLWLAVIVLINAAITSFY